MVEPFAPVVPEVEEPVVPPVPPEVVELVVPPLPLEVVEVVPVVLLFVELLLDEVEEVLVELVVLEFSVLPEVDPVEVLEVVASKFSAIEFTLVSPSNPIEPLKHKITNRFFFFMIVKLRLKLS